MTSHSFYEGDGKLLTAGAFEFVLGRSSGGPFDPRTS